MGRVQTQTSVCLKSLSLYCAFCPSVCWCVVLSFHTSLKQNTYELVKLLSTLFAVQSKSASCLFLLIYIFCNNTNWNISGFRRSCLCQVLRFDYCFCMCTSWVFLSDHLKLNGKSTGDITPKSVWRPGEIMSPPPKLREQTEAVSGVTYSSKTISTNQC